MYGFCSWVLKSQLLHDVIFGFLVHITSSFYNCLPDPVTTALCPLLPAGLTGIYVHLVSLWPCPDGTLLGYSSIGSLYHPSWVFLLS